MYLRSKTVLLWTLPVVILVCAVSAVLIRGASAQNPIQTRTGKVRNLSLQPEAFKLSRRLGNRFTSSRQTFSTLAGTLVTGVQQQEVNVVRSKPTWCNGWTRAARKCLRTLFGNAVRKQSRSFA